VTNLGGKISDTLPKVVPMVSMCDTLENILYQQLKKEKSPLYSRLV
jgi:hypothetical protein